MEEKEKQFRWPHKIDDRIKRKSQFRGIRLSGLTNILITGKKLILLIMFPSSRVSFRIVSRI